MSRKNKNPNIINVRDAIEIFGAYSLIARPLNHYQLRIHDDETGHMWDWYHTTGSLVRTMEQGVYKSATIRDAEDCAIFIRNKEDE